MAHKQLFTVTLFKMTGLYHFCWVDPEHLTRKLVFINREQNVWTCKLHHSPTIHPLWQCFDLKVWLSLWSSSPQPPTSFSSHTAYSIWVISMLLSWSFTYYTLQVGGLLYKYNGVGGGWVYLFMALVSKPHVYAFTGLYGWYVDQVLKINHRFCYCHKDHELL